MNLHCAVESLPEIADRVIDQYLPDRKSTRDEIADAFWLLPPLTLREQVLFAREWWPGELAFLESMKASGKAVR